MTSAFFTTDDGDIVLRAGSEPDSKHDFRVHKIILSLASPVFKDMLAIPQPTDQALDEEHRLPIVDVPEAPGVFDTILRLIYPGVDPPKIVHQSTLGPLLFAADKYSISSIYPVLAERLKAFSGTLWAYIMACRFGLSEVAKEAAKVSSTASLSRLGNREDIRHVSSTDLFRLVQFVLKRESEGLQTIRQVIDPLTLEDIADCLHCGDDAQDYYFRLQKAVEGAFVQNPCVGAGDLLAVLDRVPDPPPGCDPHPKSAAYLSETGDFDHLKCPLRPMTIRGMLHDIADTLRLDRDELLREFF